MQRNRSAMVCDTVLNADLPIKSFRFAWNHYLQCFAFIVSRIGHSLIANFYQLCIIVRIIWKSCEDSKRISARVCSV